MEERETLSGEERKVPSLNEGDRGNQTVPGTEEGLTWRALPGQRALHSLLI